MSKNISIGLCINRLNSGKEKLAVCKLLCKSGYYKDANNRAYYSIFNSIRAILATIPIDFKRHKDVIAYFNQHFIKTEIFPRELGHKISLANAIREDSDYLDSYMINKTETEEQIQTAKEVSQYAEKYIKQWLKENTDMPEEEINKQILNN